MLVPADASVRALTISKRVGMAGGVVVGGIGATRGWFENEDHQLHPVATAALVGVGLAAFGYQLAELARQSNPKTKYLVDAAERIQPRTNAFLSQASRHIVAVGVGAVVGAAVAVALTGAQPRAAGAGH